MKRHLFYLLIISLIFHSCHTGAPEIIWQIGVADTSAAEFALAPDKYADFLGHDFGWEDRFYLVGKSSPGEDWPYVLPGPADGWGGTSGTAGLRTHVLNILFGMQHVPAKGDWKLIVGLLNAQEKAPPLFKITVNGKSWKYTIPKGDGKIDGTPAAILQRIEIPLETGIIREGGNEINLTNLEGSWLVFDDIRLEGPRNAKLQPVNPSAYIRSVKAADYSIDLLGLSDPVGLNDTKNPAGAAKPETKPAGPFRPGRLAQPLLVDIEHLAGTPLLTVELDGKPILEQPLEEGRYVLEAPMPAVEKATESNYVLRVDGKTLAKGKLTRTPQQKTITPADYVSTFPGTAHSRWMIAPGPWMPFSMVKLSPDNQNSGWQAGYQPSFESIGTFSHIHEWTMAGLGIMPVTGPLKTGIGDQSSLVKQDGAYRSAIDKSSEEAPLGYYKVKLTDYDITAELTATTRCGFQRYTYPSGANARVMIDLQIPTEYGYNILEAEMRQVGPRRVEGFSKQQTKYVWSHDADQDYTVHFVIDFDHDIKKFGGWINDRLSENTPLAGKDVSRAGCYVEFDTNTGGTIQQSNGSTIQQFIVQARSAISYVGLDGARRNLKTEVEDPFGWDFEAVRQHQLDTWNDLLGRVQVSSNDRREKMRFYTNLYRSFCRNTFSDIDGRWVDATENTQKFTDPDAVALGCDAFWNTFWNLNQVWNLVAPEWTGRWVKSQLAMYDANGWLAKGPAGMEYIPVMVAEHEIPLLVSAYQMGIRNYDAEKMFAAAKKMQTTLPARVGDGYAGNRDLAVYLRHRYVPADKGRFSNTLEYSYDDWTVSQLAKALGKDADYKLFADRGNWWRNSIEPDSGYAHLRYADGSWDKNFDPFKSGANHHYVEGNAWQLTFFVPQDVPALAEAIGKQRFIDRLTWGFEASEPWRYNAPGDQYWDFPVVQGNQQSMHFAFLFNWVGQPWQTQRWSRSIIDRYYGFEVANAYLGDEDQGQMSAWFVMAALGLFQTDGGCNVEPVYEIASPLFEKTVINLGERFGRGKTFTIEAKGASRANKYVQSAGLNGKPLTSFKFPAKELLEGGVLKLEMGPEPNKGWGVE